MKEQKPLIGKKGAGRRVAAEFRKIREAPLSKEILRIIEEHNKRCQENLKKRPAKSKNDVEI